MLGRMSIPLAPEAEAIVADRARVWEVRRFCQIANRLPQKIDHDGNDCEQITTPRQDRKADAALSALVRCLLYELDADIAAVSLLDDRTQYFLSVVSRSNLHDPTITADSSRWYSCTSASHRGGLCAQTITMDDRPGFDDVFEVWDLSASEDTKHMPVVNGTAANFRHYVGVPLKIAGGLSIGTLFIFKKEAAQAKLSPAHCHYMCETARHAVDQITQTVEALEARQVLLCNSVVSSLANVHELGLRPSPLQVKGVAVTAHQYAISASGIYQGATSLLSQVFNLDSVTIQEAPWSNTGSNLSQSRRETLLASHSTTRNFTPQSIEDAMSTELLKTFPSGAVLHLLEPGEGRSLFFESANDGSGDRKTIHLDLRETLPLAEQVVFLPLWDTFHDRNVAFILGGTADSTRVLSSRADLSSLMAFGVTVMTQIRRLGAQTLERRKADFLGSISHEMRSPLHGILACIDLLLDEDCSREQLDLLHSAESCGLQLRDNIDNLLHYSNIGSPSPNLTQRGASKSSRKGQRGPISSTNHDGRSMMEKFNFLDLIDETVEKDSRISKGMTPSAERSNGWVTIEEGETEIQGCLTQPVCQPAIIVDVEPSALFSLKPHSGIDVIIDSLLSNSIKFTKPSGCVRVSIDSDSLNTTLFFTDSGRGISNDFIRHNLFVPFEQQDPLDSGTGLGLSLAHSMVKSLGGDIIINTDQSQGTAVSVTLPRDRLADSLDASSQGIELAATDEHSSLTVGLFSPTQWTNTEDPRQQRCMHSFSESLARTIKSWCNIDLTILASPSHEMEPIMLDIVVLLHTDLEHFKEKTGGAYEQAQKIVLCPDLQAQLQVQEQGTHVVVVGPVCPWKIRTAFASYRSNITAVSNSTHIEVPAPPSYGYNDAQLPQTEPGSESPVPFLVNDEDGKYHNTAAPVPVVADSPSATGLDQLNLETKEDQREPKFLLVDDNNINLKVVAAYAKKCSRLPFVTAGGGREAIDAFKTARSAADSDGIFDIVLLDLSMPEISGFEVAAAIRELERAEPGLPRTYISALTGLISDKDRAAAFAAGVDEYVTKPAALKALQNVVANWRNSKLDQDAG